MGWINVFSFSLWIYGEEIFRRDLKQKEKSHLKYGFLQNNCRYILEGERW